MVHAAALGATLALIGAGPSERRPRSFAATSRGGDCRRHLGRRAANGLAVPRPGNAPATTKGPCRPPEEDRDRLPTPALPRSTSRPLSLVPPSSHELPATGAPGRFERSPEGAARTRNDTDRNDIASALLSLVRIDFLVGSRGGTITKRSRTREDPFPHLAMPGIACPTYTYHMKRVMGSE